jgi:hypothetical protein
MSQLSTPTVLLECADVIEASAKRSLLLQHGIDAVIQTENVSAMMPHLQPIMAPRLLVPGAQLERAQAILEANQVIATQGAEPLEGGVCAVHEGQAVATCSRCGSFLCEACGSLGEPPVCESCLEAEALPPRNTSAMRPALVLMVGLVVVALVLILLFRL